MFIYAGKDSLIQYQIDNECSS